MQADNNEHANEQNGRNKRLPYRPTAIAIEGALALRHVKRRRAVPADHPHVDGLHPVTPGKRPTAVDLRSSIYIRACGSEVGRDGSGVGRAPRRAAEASE
jgi:hypothetical protein